VALWPKPARVVVAREVLGPGAIEGIWPQTLDAISQLNLGVWLQKSVRHAETTSPDTRRGMFHVQRRHKKWRNWLTVESLCAKTTKNEANRSANPTLPVAHSASSEFKKVNGRDGFETEA
jgi:hypothetical protein